MHIQPHSHMLCLHHDVSINRMKHAQMKIKGDDVPLYLTVIGFLSLRTTLDSYCDVERDKKSYRVTLIDRVYRKYTVQITNDNNHLIFKIIRIIYSNK